MRRRTHGTRKTGIERITADSSQFARRFLTSTAGSREAVSKPVTTLLPVAESVRNPTLVPVAEFVTIPTFGDTGPKSHDFSYGFETASNHFRKQGSSPASGASNRPPRNTGTPIESASIRRIRVIRVPFRAGRSSSAKCVSHPPHGPSPNPSCRVVPAEIEFGGP